MTLESTGNVLSRAAMTSRLIRIKLSTIMKINPFSYFSSIIVKQLVDSASIIET